MSGILAIGVACAFVAGMLQGSARDNEPGLKIVAFVLLACIAVLTTIAADVVVSKQKKVAADCGTAAYEVINKAPHKWTVANTWVPCVAEDEE